MGAWRRQKKKRKTKGTQLVKTSCLIKLRPLCFLLGDSPLAMLSCRDCRGSAEELQGKSGICSGDVLSLSSILLPDASTQKARGPNPFISLATGRPWAAGE